MIRSLLRLNRAIRFIATITAIAGIGIGGFIIVRTAPYSVVKIIVENEMSRIFKQEITIESMSGNIISQATFKGIRFKNNPKFGHPGTVLEIGEATAHYSLVKAFAHKGDFAAATYRIYVRNVIVNTHRAKDDQWNVLMILPPPDPSLPPQPLTFTGRLYLDQMTIRFQDDRGWGEAPLKKPFIDTIANTKGIMDFRDIRNARIVLHGRLESAKSPFRLAGNLDTTTGLSVYDISIKSAPISKWGPYVFPHPGFELTSGNADVNAHVRSKYMPSPTDLPFWYDVNVTFHGSRFKLPIFEPAMEQIEGQINLSNSRVEAADVPNRVTQKTSPKNILNILRKLRILDQNYRVRVTLKGSQIDPKAPLPATTEPWRESIESLATQPPSKVVLNIRSAIVAGTPISLAGIVHLDRAEMALQIRSDHAKTETIKALFPTLSKWKIEGIGTTSMNVVGAITSPSVQGTMRFDLAKAYGFPLTQLQLHYVYKDRELRIGSDSGAVHDGMIGITATVNIGNPTRINATLTTEKMNVQKIGSGTVIGLLSTTIKVEGPTPKLALSIVGNSDGGLLWQNQRINSATIDGWVLDGTNVVISSANFGVNGSSGPLHAFGLIRNWEVAEFGFETTELNVRDLDHNESGIGRFVGNGRVRAILTPEFWEDPASTLTVTANGILFNYPLYGQHFDEIRLDVTRFPRVISVRRVDARVASQTVSIEGEFIDSVPQRLRVTATDFHVGDRSVVQKLIPANLKPFYGTISGTLLLTSLKPARVPTLSTSHINASGNIKIVSGLVRGQPFDVFMMVGDWQNQMFTIRQAVMQVKKSTIAIQGSFASDKTLDIHILNNTQIDLKDFQTIAGSWLGEVSGTGNIEGRITGHTSAPNIELNLDFSNLAFGAVQIDRIKGAFGYVNRRLVAKSLAIRPSGGEFLIDGYFNLETLLSRDPLPLDYDLTLTISPTSLTTLATLIESVRKEWLVRYKPDTISGEELVRNANVKVTVKTNPFLIDAPANVNQKVLIYAQDNDETAFGLYTRIFNRQRYASYINDLGLVDILSGSFSGSIHAKSRGSRPPDVSANIEFSDTTASLLYSKKLVFKVNTSGLENRFSLQIGKGSLGGSPFEGIMSEGTYSEDGYLTKINGTVENPVLSTSKVELVDAYVALNEELVPLTSPLKITTGNFEIRNNKIIIQNLSVNWSGPDTIRLTGTTPDTNQLRINGTIDIEQLKLADAEATILDMNLRVDPTRLTLNFPKIYHGMVDIQSLTIAGPYTIPISGTAKIRHELNAGTDEETGPMISGKMTLFDGELVMPTLGDKPLRPSFVLNISGDIRQNVSLVGSLVGDGLIANIANRFNLSLAQTTSPLGIGGTLNAPRIQNSIVIETGELNILNRSFELLSIDRQRNYTKGNHYKLHNNTVEFRNDYSGRKTRLVPYLNVTALTIIEPLITSTTNSTLSAAKPDTEMYSHVIINIDGPVYNLQGFEFQKFVAANESSERVEYRGTYRLGLGQRTVDSTDTAAIIKMLAPELVTNTSAQNQGNTNLVIQQIGSGAINTISHVALRGIEREIAKNVGLDAFQINYNLGHALFGSNQTVGLSVQKSLLSNSLMVRARTDVDVERRKYTNTLQLSELELSYYLQRNWSLNFGNHIDEFGNSKNRYTVKYSYDF
ncbi:DUF748 domain-containing protein [bacterium]|nr:DUF748 domain-containing protein [bacterium]